MFNFSFDVNWLLFMFYKSSLNVFRMDCSGFTIKIFTAAKKNCPHAYSTVKYLFFTKFVFFNIDNASNNQTIQVKAMKRRQNLDFLHYYINTTYVCYNAHEYVWSQHQLP